MRKKAAPPDTQGASLAVKSDIAHKSPDKKQVVVARPPVRGKSIVICEDNYR